MYNKNNTHNGGGHANIRSPAPKRPTNLKLSQSANDSNINLARNVFHSPLASGVPVSGTATPLTPNPNPIEQTRLEGYNLDLPNATEVDDIYNPESRFYSRVKPRTINLQQQLPYETELPLDQSRYLSHILSHLYIAIRSLDIGGAISISSKDLEQLKKHLSAISQVAGVHHRSPEDDEELEETGAEGSEGSYDSDDSGSDDSDASDEDVEDDFSGEISSGLGSAGSYHGNPNSSVVVSVRNWTQELRTWIKMKNNLPFDLRIALAKVYYDLALTNGSSIPIPTFVKMFILLIRYEPTVLKKRGLLLDFRPLFRLLDTKYPQANAFYDTARYHSRKQLFKLGISASYFYPEKDFDELFSLIGSRFSLNTASISLASYLCLLPLHSSKLLDLLPSMFHIWSTVNKTKGVDSHLTNILGVGFEKILAGTHETGDAILNKFGDYGFLAKDQLLFILNQLLNSLNIQPHKFGYSSSGNFYVGYANIIVFSINGDRALDQTDGIFFHLEALLNSIETYLHPSNTDVWSVTCTRFIQDLIVQFYRRQYLENDSEETLSQLPPNLKLSEKVVKKFVKLLLPKVLLGLQSKRSSIVNINVECIGLLCELQPELVLNVLLLDIYESLQSVISNHRLTVALKLLAKLSKYLVTQKVFRCHVTRLLSLVLPGIDSNDLEKTLLTLNVISSFASYLPFYNLSIHGLKGLGDDIQFVDSGLAFEMTQNHLQFLSEKVFDNKKIEDQREQEVFHCVNEENVLISSSCLFEDFFSVLIFKIFTLLENLPDQSLHQSNSEASLETALPRTLLILFSSLSDEYFGLFSNRFLTFINENIQYNTIDLSAEIIGAIVKHDPKTQTSKFMDLILDKINDEIKNGNAGKVRSGVDVPHRDKPLFNYLAILSEIVRYSGEQVLNYSFKLTNLSRLLLREVKGPIMYNASFLVTQLLKTLTTIRLQEHRLLSPEYVAKHGVTGNSWGGFYNDQERLLESNLSFKWHVPDRREIEFAVQFYGEHVNECFKNLDLLMQNSSPKKPAEREQDEILSDDERLQKSKGLLEFADSFRKNLLYLSHSSSGIAYLLDPGFPEKQAEQAAGHKLNTYLLDKRLRSLNLSQRSLASPITTEENTRTANTEATTPQEPADPNTESDSKPSNHNDLELEEQDFNSISLSRMASDISLANLDQVNMSRESSIGMDLVTLDRDGDKTPGFESNLVNPEITSRAQKIYTSNYFFGNTKEERQKNDLYKRVHLLSKQVGQKLHEICQFLKTNYPNDVKLFRTFLHTVQVWFCDCGSEQSLKSFDDSFVTYKYLKGLQDVPFSRKPFTRMTFAARIERYHRQRVVIHSGSRIQTKLDKVLLDDIIGLSMSVYSSISTFAQDALDSAMKKIVGSYGILIQSVFKNLTSVLKEKDPRKVKSALRMFTINKLKNRIYSDYRNVCRFVLFLLKSLSIDDQETTELARSFYKKLSELIHVPILFCSFNEKCANYIKPPDSIADHDAKLLRAAKQKKLSIYYKYLKELEHLVFTQETSGKNHWKTSLISLEILVTLQTDYNSQTNKAIMELLVQRAKVTHPTISNIAISGLVRLFSKLKMLSTFSYNIDDIYDAKFSSKETVAINTNSDTLRHNFSEDFYDELSKTKDFSYFIDNKVYRGWLFWGDNLIAIKSSYPTELELKDHEINLLNDLSALVTKDWLSEIIKHAVEENEENSKFQGNHVLLIADIVHFITADYFSNISYRDIVEIGTSIYVRDEKSAHVIVCEIMTGLLLASKVTPQELISVRDGFVIGTLEKAFKDLLPENKSIWKVFSWWLASHVDIRRYNALIKDIFDYVPVPGEESPLIQATRLSCLKACLSTITWKYRDADKLVKNMLELILHPYQIVREQVAGTFNVALYCYFNQSYANAHSFITANKESGCLGLTPYQLPDHVKNHLIQAFEAVEYFRMQVSSDSSVQETLNSPYIYGTRTLIVLVNSILHFGASISIVELIPKHISPFLLHLEEMRDVCKLANISAYDTFLRLAKISYRNEHIGIIVKLILDDGGIKNPSYHQRLLILSFAEVFYFRQLSVLSSEERQSLFSYVSELLFHQNLEVREVAANALSGMIHCSPTKEREEIILLNIEKHAQVLRHYKVLSKKKKKNAFKQPDAVKLHGATLGLGALVSAFPYTSPPPEWFPHVLGLLANNVFGVFGVVDKTSKGVLSNFKKTRQDTWHIDSKVFSEEELEDLEGVLRESYFV